MSDAAKKIVAKHAVSVYTDIYGKIAPEREDAIIRLLLNSESIEDASIPSEEFGNTPPIIPQTPRVPIEQMIPTERPAWRSEPDINVHDCDKPEWNVRANIEREYQKAIETTYGRILPPLGTIVESSIDLKPPYTNCRVAGWIPKYGNRIKHVVMEPVNGNKIYCLTFGDFQRILQWAGI